jgi:hypothetical protein
MLPRPTAPRPTTFSVMEQVGTKNSTSVQHRIVNGFNLLTN